MSKNGTKERRWRKVYLEYFNAERIIELCNDWNDKPPYDFILFQSIDSPGRRASRHLCAA